MHSLIVGRITRSPVQEVKNIAGIAKPDCECALVVA